MVKFYPNNSVKLACEAFGECIAAVLDNIIAGS